MNCCDRLNEMCDVLKNSSCVWIMVWICPYCDAPNQSNASFYGSLDSLCSKNVFDPLNQEFSHADLPSQGHVYTCHKYNKRQSQPKRNGVSCLLTNCQSIKLIQQSQEVWKPNTLATISCS